MRVCRDHGSVDSEGLVSIPYLHTYLYNEDANLCELIGHLESVFSASPPLYAVPTQISQPPPQAPISQPIVSPFPKPTQFDASIRTGPHPSGARVIAPAPVDVRKQLEDEVNEKLRREVEQRCMLLKDTIDETLHEQSTLAASQDQTSAQIHSLTQLQESLEIATNDLESKRSRLGAWIEDMRSTRDSDAETFLSPHDEVSNQIVRLNAEQLAIEDTMYYLERAIASRNHPGVDMGVFLKEMRSLSRRQFLCKMHLNKINAVMSGLVNTVR